MSQYSRLFERFGPAAVLLNEFVDLVHQVVSANKGRDDLFVVVDIINGKNSAFSVLKPFLCRAIAADGEVPDFRLDALEVLVTVDERSAWNSTAWRRIPHPVYRVVPRLREDRGLITLRFQQVEGT